MSTVGVDHRHDSVIFDLWGTLVPFRAAAWAEELARIAAELGASPDEFRQAWRARYAERITGDVEACLRDVCQALSLPADEAAVQRALEIRLAAHADMFVPRPEAVPALRQLRALGYRLGLVSNCSSEIPRLWQDSPLSPLVDTALFSCTERLRKPDPAIFTLAAQRLGTQPGRCVFVGDGGDGELPGAAATGMHAILLRAEDTDPPEHWTGPEISLLSDVVDHLPGQA
jgi:putative hydrolase of the HAD superfamily